MEGTTKDIAFGPFRLDCDGERLWRGSDIVPLRRKTWALLRYLAERPQRLISKDELLDALWPGVAVYEEAVARAVRELRQALGDRTRQPLYIEVVYGRGFRFLPDGRTAAATDTMVGGTAEPWAAVSSGGPAEVGLTLNRRWLRIGLLLLGWCVAALARPATATDQDGQAWLLATARGAIHGSWKLYLETQPRLDGSGARQLIVRPALGYQVTPQWSLWQGYGWTPSFNGFRDEQRIFQQSLIETPRGPLPVALVNRTRLEQRWIEDSRGTAWRLRHMLRLVYPLDRKGTWALAAYDEPFVALNSAGGGPQSGFDQNRAFFGANRSLGDGLRLEVGYLNQWLNVRRGQPDLARHVALVWLDFVW